MNQDIRPSRQARGRLMGEIAMAIRVSGAASDVFDEAVSVHLGINRTDLLCLDLIERGRATTAGDLARESGLTTGAVTAVLDRLERRQLLRRVRDETDRRKVLLELVPKAGEALMALYAPMAAYTEGALRRFSDDELQRMLVFFQAGSEFVLAQAEQLRDRSDA